LRNVEGLCEELVPWWWCVTLLPTALQLERHVGDRAEENMGLGI